MKMMMITVQSTLMSLSLLLFTSWNCKEAHAGFAPYLSVDGVPTRSRLLSWIGSTDELEAAKRAQQDKTAELKKAAILKDAAIDLLSTETYRDIFDDMRTSILSYKTVLDQKDTEDIITEEDTDGRRLQEACGDLFQDVFMGNCTLQEYCQVLDDSFIEADITCTGDLNTTWSSITTSPESCIYVSQAGAFALAFPSPYDQEEFDPALDFCYQVIFTIDFNMLDEVGQTEFYNITRGGSGSYTKKSMNVPCNATDPESDTCSECVEASFDDTICTSCTNCLEDSTGPRTALVCDNVAPGFVQTCDDDDDSVILTLFFESGALCTFQGWLDGLCSPEDFCAIIESISLDLIFEDAVPTITCALTGSPDTDWTLVVSYGELCWYNSTGGRQGVYNETLIDLSQDYCFTEREGVSGTGSQVTGAKGVFTITNPCEITLTTSYPVKNCDDGVDQRMLQDGGEVSYNDEYEDDIFFPSFCTEECGEITVGGRECTSGCKTCPDGQVLGTCFNVADDVEETCGSDFPDTQLDYAIIAYCLENPPTEPPTMMPSVMDSPTTDRGSTATGILHRTVPAIVFVLCSAVVLMT